MQQPQIQRQHKKHGGDDEPASTFPDGFTPRRTPDTTAETLRKIGAALGEHGVRSANS